MISRLTTISLVFALVCIAAFACVEEPQEPQTETPQELIQEEADLTLVSCDPESQSGCERGEACLEVASDRMNEPATYVCATNRCNSARDCSAGYVCRANHCLAVDRDLEENGGGNIDLAIASDVLLQRTARAGVYNISVGVGSLNHSRFENLWFTINLVNGRDVLAAARRPAPVQRDRSISRVTFENIALEDGTFISIDHSNLVDETNENNNKVRVP